MRFLFLNQTQFLCCTFNPVVLRLPFWCLYVDLCPVGLLRANFWGGFFLLLEQVAVQSAWGVFSELCPSAGVCPLCGAGDRDLLLLFCFLVLSPPQCSPVCWAVLLFWTGQPCHYLTLEFSVCALCIVFPYGQMANLIRL